MKINFRCILVASDGDTIGKEVRVVGADTAAFFFAVVNK